MRVVSNTSPLLNLAIIDRLDLVSQQLGSVLIPTAVAHELKLEEERPGSRALRKATDEDGWIVLRQVGNETLCRALRLDLDHGEAEAIALALEAEADLVLIDEREGRRVAKSMGLKVTGLVGLLLQAYRQGQIPSIERELELLQEKAGFWLDSKLKNQILSSCSARMPRSR